MPVVAHLRKVHDGVFIGRPTKWGNPFVIGQHGSRAEVIARFAAYLEAHPALKDAARQELRGKDLLCYCAPKPCHGDVLLKIAND